MQQPRVRHAPLADRSDAGDAAFLAGSYGLTPDEWQENVLEGWLGIRVDGKWAAPRCGLAVPRQNGKNGVIEMRELHGMVALGERFLHTAHEVKTARKAFARLLWFFDNRKQYPELAELVQEIRRTNGQEAIVLSNGGSVEFIARSKGSGRGFSVDVLVLDEAQELSDDALAALLPTISASANPQTITTGTPPGPTVNGEVFTRMRDAGLDGKDRRLCWMEWGCEGAIDLDDRAQWANANPALGIRLSYEATADERAAMDEETFARERLGMWAGIASNSVIDLDTWALMAEPAGNAGDVVAFAVDVSPDREHATIGSASERGDKVWVEAFDRRKGTGWVVDRAVQLQKWNPRTFVVDAAGPAASLIPDLQRARVKLTITNAREMAQACGSFYDMAMQGRLIHPAQPGLDDALKVARKRPLGDAWAWNRKDGNADITPLVAVTLAAHGLALKRKRTRSDRPKRKVLVLS